MFLTLSSGLEENVSEFVRLFFLFWFPIFVQFVLDATRISFELAGLIKLIPVSIFTLVSS